MTTAGSSAEARQVARGLAYVCGHLQELRKLLNDDGTDPAKPLTRLVSAIEAAGAVASSQPSSAGTPTGGDIAALLRQVHASVQHAGDVVGIYGYSRRGTAQSGMEALQIIYRCPLQRCAGRLEDSVTELNPKCTMSPNGLPLIRDRL